MINDSSIIIGVLALQGDFQEHENVLKGLNIASIQVRSIKDLEQCDALILPGGESTVQWMLMQSSGLDQSIKKCIQEGMPVLGTCAGAILLSDSHLNVMDITVERNAYGSQAQSFSTEITIDDTQVRVEFIRAPKVTRIGDDIEVLALQRDNPVFVQQKNLLVTTFHTETTDSSIVHETLLGMCLSKISVQ